MTLIGSLALTQVHSIGTLMHMGPGFFPMTLGVLLVFLGVLFAINGVASSPDQSDQVESRKNEWWGWTCIIAGPILFMILGEYGGMAPATFACVFVSALGDRTATWKGSLILALAVTVFGVLLQCVFPGAMRPAARRPVLRVAPQRKGETGAGVLPGLIEGRFRPHTIIGGRLMRCPM